MGIFGAILCVLTGALWIFTIAALCKKKGIFDSPLECWLSGIGIFFVVTCILYYALSVVPIAKPINHLIIPLQYLFLATGLYMLKPAGVAALLRHTGTKIHAIIGGIDWIWSICIVFFLLILALYTAWGMLIVPITTDELAYHVPQAIGIFQEGKMEVFSAPPVWIETYPKGIAILNSWTMLFTGGDHLFELMQGLYGLQFIFGTILLARRIGADKVPSLIAMFSVIAMPIFALTVQISSADLGYHAAIICSIAFLSPRHSPGERTHQDLMLSIVFLSQAIFCKPPFFALIYFSLASGYFFLCRVRFSQVPKFFVFFAKKPLWILLLIIAVGAPSFLYVKNWIITGNPVFPLSVSIGSIKIWNGPLGSIEDAAFYFSTFGEPRKMSWLQRWIAVFADWYQPLNENSFGGMGPIFLVIAGPLAIAWALSQIRSIWGATVILLLFIVLFIPAAFVPRYVLAWYGVILASAAAALSQINIKLQSGIRFLSMIIITTTLYIPANFIYRGYQYFNWIANSKSVFVDRGNSRIEKEEIDPFLYPSHKMINIIRTQIKAGQVLGYSVRVHASLLWNKDFSNVVRYLYDASIPGGQVLDASCCWLEKFRQANPDWLLMYNVPPANKLLKEVPANYKIVYQDPIGNSGDRKFTMVLYKKE